MCLRARSRAERVRKTDAAHAGPRARTTRTRARRVRQEGQLTQHAPREALACCRCRAQRQAGLNPCRQIAALLHACASLSPTRLPSAYTAAFPRLVMCTACARLQHSYMSMSCTLPACPAVQTQEQDTAHDMQP